MPAALTRCDCIVNCNHKYPEITIGTRYNHRRDDKIDKIQAILAGDSLNNIGSRRHNHGRSSQHPGIPQSGPRHSSHSHPYPSSHPPPFQSHSREPPRAQTTHGPHLPRQTSEHPHSGHHTPAPATSSSFPLTGRTEAALKLMEAEIWARSLMFSTSLATPLVFVNKPVEHGVYQHQSMLVPNTGLYSLKSGVLVNANFLEHENRLWELIGQAHIRPPCGGKDKL